MTTHSDPIRSITAAVLKNPLRPTDRALFLEDYLAAATTTDKKDPGYLAQERAFVEEFLDHPERFRLTEHALKTAYSEFVAQPRGHFVWPQEVGTDKCPIDASLIRNVGTRLEYAYSSTAGCRCAVHVTTAEVLNGGEWEPVDSGGIAFCLRDWIEKTA